MAAIATVGGEVDPSELGTTLFHEHLLMLSPGLLSNWPQAFDRAAELNRAVALLEDRIATVAAVCERGLASQVLLSHDAAGYYDALPLGFGPDD